MDTRPIAARFANPFLLSLALLALSLGACGRKPAPAPVALAPGLHPWALPAGPGSGQPDLVRAPDGRLLLSWLESQPGRRTRFQYAEFGNDARWLGPKTIAIGASFVVNWADTPHILATPDGAIWVQWLQKHGDGHDVVVSTSRNDGMNWSEPARPHDDGTATEHGFASLWAIGNDRLGVAWLDGRDNAAAHGNMHGDAHGAAPAGGAALYNAWLDGALAKDGEDRMDELACDCCQTDVVATSKGPLLVYRDRTDEDVRDIVATRHDGRFWRPARPVHADGWKINACPVNGPAVAASQANTLVAWYTAANDMPVVKLARSVDAGDAFATPIDVDRGAAVQGRVDVALDARNAWVAWLREDANGQSLWLARYAPDLSREIERIEVAKLAGRGRGTGFPKLVLRGGDAYLAWTDIADGVPALHGAVYVPKG